MMPTVLSLLLEEYAHHKDNYALPAGHLKISFEVFIHYNHIWQVVLFAAKREQ